MNNKTFSSEFAAAQYEMNLFKFLWLYAKYHKVSFIIQAVIAFCVIYTIGKLPAFWWL